MSNPDDVTDARTLYLAPVSPPPRRDRSLIAILLLAILAFGGIIALLPGPEEKAEGLFADGRYEEAIATLASIEDERPLDEYESHMLFKLYVLTRQAERAAFLLRREPSLQAETAWTLRQLAQLYRETSDFTGEASTLRQLYEFSPEAADFTRLRMLYRLSGDHTNEASLLALAIGNGDASEAHAKRLAYLHSEPQASKLSAIWISPFSSFVRVASPSRVAASMSGGQAAPKITSIE